MSITHTENAGAGITATFRGSVVSSWMMSRALIRLNPVTRWLRRVGWILIVVGFGSAVVSDAALTAGLIATALGLLIVVIMGLSPLVALWAGRGTHGVEQTWQFSADRIQCTAGELVSVIDWAVVTKILDTKRFVVLAFSDRAQSFVPKKAFRTPTPAKVLEEFRTRATDQLRSPRAVDAREPLLQITFKWTTTQLYRTSLEVSKKGTRMWLIYLLCAVVGLVTALPAITYAVETGAPAPLWSLIYPVGLPAFVFLTGRLGGYWWARSHLRSSNTASKQQIVDVFETEIRAYGTGFNTTIPYTSIKRLAQSEEFLLLFLAKVQAIAIPKVALQPDQQEWLAQFLTQRLTNSN